MNLIPTFASEGAAMAHELRTRGAFGSGVLEYIRSDRATVLRHGRACHPKSGLPDFGHLNWRTSGLPEVRCHPAKESSVRP